jgi:pimeloyl-ACP methyl ester carboxylesterase
MRHLPHNKVELALHELRAGTGRPLLLLHGLGERTPDAAPAEVAGWPGPVLGLDFTGHGRSSVPRGGGYSAELLMADVDVTLAAVAESLVLAPTTVAAALERYAG